MHPFSPLFRALCVLFSLPTLHWDDFGTALTDLDLETSASKKPSMILPLTPALPQHGVHHAELSLPM